MLKITPEKIKKKTISIEVENVEQSMENQTSQNKEKHFNNSTTGESCWKSSPKSTWQSFGLGQDLRTHYERCIFGRTQELSAFVLEKRTHKICCSSKDSMMESLEYLGVTLKVSLSNLLFWWAGFGLSCDTYCYPRSRTEPITKPFLPCKRAGVMSRCQYSVPVTVQADPSYNLNGGFDIMMGREALFCLLWM